MDGMLSQEEINALLSGMGSDDSSASADSAPAADAGAADAGGYSDSLTEAEKDAVGEVSNISMGTAATTLSTLLNQKVNITTPKVSYARWDEFLQAYERPCVFIQIYYTAGLDGNNILIMIKGLSAVLCHDLIDNAGDLLRIGSPLKLGVNELSCPCDL